MSEHPETCKFCSAPQSTRAATLFGHYCCGTYHGEEWHQSERCKRSLKEQPKSGDMQTSRCCGAPIDASHAIKEGHYAGHGSYYCSKCGKLAYIV